MDAEDGFNLVRQITRNSKRICHSGCGGVRMAKCFLTGIEVPMENAYLLDQGATRRALRSLRERVAAMERLLAQFTPRDSVEVYDYKTRKPAVKPQRRLVCQSVASALSALYPEAQLFITWPQFRERCVALSQQSQTKPNGTAPASTQKPMLVPAPVTPEGGTLKEKGNSKKQKTAKPQGEKADTKTGGGHVSAQ